MLYIFNAIYTIKTVINAKDTVKTGIIIYRYNNIIVNTEKTKSKGKTIKNSV